MPRETVRQSREQASEQPRSAPSSRLTPAGRSSQSSPSARSAQNPAAGRSASNQGAGRSASNQGAGRSASNPAANRSAQSQAPDRERRIETGRESARASSPAQARDNAPGIYQYSSGLASSPFTLVRRMAEDMDRLFQDFGISHSVGPAAFNAPALGLARDTWRQPSRQAWAPQIEAFRRGDRLVVRADLPGLKKDEVKVEVDGDVLAISGERRDEREENRDDYYRSERSYGRFYRAVPLPEGINADQCDASFKDGVLEVSFPAPNENASGRRQIQVR